MGRRIGYEAGHSIFNFSFLFFRRVPFRPDHEPENRAVVKGRKGRAIAHTPRQASLSLRLPCGVFGSIATRALRTTSAGMNET